MGVKQSSESNLWCTCANDSSYQPEFSSFLSPTGDEKTLYVPYIDELSPTATTKNAFELPLGLTLSSLRADDIVDGGDDICDACDDLSVMSAISPTKERRRVASQRLRAVSKEDLPFERLLSKLHLDEAPGLEMVISADCLLHQALSRDDVDFITSILSKDGLDISTIRFKETGESALHVATMGNNLAAVRFILAQPNLNLNAKDFEGMTSLQRALQWDGIDPDVLHALGDARQAQFMQSPCSPWASSSHASGRSVSTSSSVRCKSGRPEAVHMTSRAGLLYGIAVENTPATESTAAKEDTCAPSPSVSDMSDPIQGSADAPPMKGSAEALHQHSVRKPKTITKRLRKAAGKAIAFVRPRNSGRDVPPRPISDRTPRSGAI